MEYNGSLGVHNSPHPDAILNHMISVYKPVSYFFRFILIFFSHRRLVFSSGFLYQGLRLKSHMHFSSSPDVLTVLPFQNVISVIKCILLKIINNVNGLRHWRQLALIMFQLFSVLSDLSSAHVVVTETDDLRSEHTSNVSVSQVVDHCSSRRQTAEKPFLLLPHSESVLLHVVWRARVLERLVNFNVNIFHLVKRYPF
jgi:hypothetical protein